MGITYEWNPRHVKNVPVYMSNRVIFQSASVYVSENIFVICNLIESSICKSSCQSKQFAAHDYIALLSVLGLCQPDYSGFKIDILFPDSKGLSDSRTAAVKNSEQHWKLYAVQPVVRRMIVVHCAEIAFNLIIRIVMCNEKVWGILYVIEEKHFVSLWEEELKEQF